MYHRRSTSALECDTKIPHSTSSQARFIYSTPHNSIETLFVEKHKWGNSEVCSIVILFPLYPFQIFLKLSELYLFTVNFEMRQ
jgi:hypothetical protein